MAATCSGCGAKVGVESSYCARCGVPLAHTKMPPPPPPPASPPPPPPHSSPPFVAQLAGAPALAGLPWQTVSGGRQVDLAAFLSAAAMPTARSVMQSSLRRPGLALLATTALDLVVAWLTGEDALAAAVPRALVATVSGLLAILAGSKAGVLRTLAGLAGAVTGTVQLGTLSFAIVDAVQAEADLLVVLPQLVILGSSFVLALKTLFSAFRRPR